MASIQFSGIGVTGARNKLGGDVFTRNRSGACVRAWVIPANTITPARTAVRNAMASACVGWTLLSPADVAKWNLLGTRVQKTNVTTGRYHPTGRNLYIESTCNFLSAGEFPIDNPDLQSVSQSIRALKISTLTNFSVFIQPVFLDGTAVVPASHITVVSASPPVSPGINYPRNNFRIIRAFTAGDDISTTELIADYSAIHGAPIVGQKVFFRIVQFNSLLGLKSIPVTITAIVM